MDHAPPPRKPPPLVPADCDVRDFPKMMVDVQRLLGSQFNAQASAEPLAWMVGHKLWYRAFHQLPGGSLPAADAELCHLAELGADLKRFRRVRELALRGWRPCADGRLYHPVVAETVLEAWIDKLLQRLKSGAGNGGKHAGKGYVFDPAPLAAALETAGAHLSRLNPRARALDKLKRRRGAPAGSALGAPPHAPAEPDRPPSAPAREGKEKERDALTESDSESTPRLSRLARDRFAALRMALAEAAGPALADPAAAPGLANLSPILNLLEPGEGPACELERDVLPAVRQACARARPGSIRAWSYFAARIAEARDARLRGAPPLGPVSPDPAFPDPTSTPEPDLRHDARRPRRPSRAAPAPAADSRRAHTERRRGAWLDLAEERDGAGPGAEPGPHGGP